MINLKVSTLVMCLTLAAGISAAGMSFLFSMHSTALSDSTDILNCKQPTVRSAETFRHAEPVSTGRNKEY